MNNLTKKEIDNALEEILMGLHSNACLNKYKKEDFEYRTDFISYYKNWCYENLYYYDLTSREDAEIKKLFGLDDDLEYLD